MGKSTPSPPAAPDPTATAGAQTASNQATALYNFGLNNPTVNTPLGSVSYSVDTSNPNQPTSTQNISLSPQQQQLYNNQTQQSIDLSNLANQLAPNVASALNQPNTTPQNITDLSNQAQNAYYNSQMAYLQPQQQQAQEQLDNQLANQGLSPGSQAWNAAEGNLSRNNTFANQQAMNSAITQGPQVASQLFGLTSAAQTQPLNEYNALRTGSQVQMPTSQGTNASAAAPTNTAAIAQQGYQNSLNGYNQSIASSNNTTNGIFGLAGAALQAAPYAMAAFSDIRLKENIKLVGNENGFPIYHFSYKADPGHRIYRGVMAQDVQEIFPTAIVSDGDYLAVRYNMIGITFGRVQ
jgi:hypothetical protein